MASTNVVQVNADNFQAEVLNAEVPVLVDFWADWCGPCKMLGPVIDQLADEYAGQVKVAKLNIETDAATKQLAIGLGITSIPALKVFKGGAVVTETIGLQPKSSLANLLNRALA